MGYNEMTYQFAICDDDGAQRDNLTHIARQWAERRGHAARVVCFPSAEAFLFQYAEDKQFDILLLDIEMGPMSGVELAKTVRAGNREAQIIFITGYMDYIADGYEVEALHYLLKPVTGAKLESVLDRAADKLKRNERALLLDLGDEQVRVPLYEIQYMEVRGKYVTVHANGDYTVRASLADLEKDLGDEFFRTGRSFIVNLKFIRRVSRTQIRLADGSAVPLPRGMYDAVNQAMIERL